MNLKVSVYFNKTYANIILGDKTISEYEKYNNKWNFEPIELNESEKTNKNSMAKRSTAAALLCTNRLCYFVNKIFDNKIECIIRFSY